MAYTKKLKTINVHLILDSEVITIVDTAEDNKASRALMEFKRYDTMHYETYEGEQNPVKVMNEIPYHAVQYIAVTETDASIEKDDPYGCEDKAEYTVTFDGCTYVNPTPEPITVNAGESITLPGHIGTTNWYDGGCDEQGNFVGGASDSYTPTSNVTLYAFEQEI